MDKIIELDKLAEIIKAKKEQGSKTILCHGVFDLLHIGHIRYLREAKKAGDFLAVTLTPDRYVDKGPGRPAFNQQLRAEALASLDVVDYVAVNQWPTAERTLAALRPDIYAKGAEFKNIGSDATGKMALEARAAEAAGVEILFIDDIVFSSSHLINRHLSTYSQEMSQYLDLIRRRYDLADVLNFVDRMAGLKVLVLGEAIIDQYAYCVPLGLSSKEPTMAVRQLGEESFPGGSIAVARHAAGLAGQVTLYTLFGENDDYGLTAVRDLPVNLTVWSDIQPRSATIRKQRFVDNCCLTKLLEIYHMSIEPLPEELTEKMICRLAPVIDEYDMVLVADYGHGLVTERLIEFLCKNAPYLAVNTQANAGNRGYHTILRYPRADFISLARHEISLAFQDRLSPTVELMTNLYQRMKPGTLMVTCGADGLEAMAGLEHVKAPAAASRVVDRVGAGDALFVSAALAARLDCPLDLMGLIGNIAGGRLVESVGNGASVDGAFIKKALTAMLK